MDEMIVRFQGRLNGHVVVVDEAQVAFMSSKGYELLAVIHQDRVQTEHQSQSEQDPTVSYGQPRTTTSVVSYVVREARYIMQLDAESAVAAVQSELVQERTERARCRAELEATKETSAEITKERDKALHEREVLARRCNVAKEDCERERERVRTYEGDIAKIRAAVGAIRMKEILGG